MTGFFIVVILWEWTGSYKVELHRSEDAACKTAAFVVDHGGKGAHVYEIVPALFGSDLVRVHCEKEKP